MKEIKFSNWTISLYNLYINEESSDNGKIQECTVAILPNINITTAKKFLQIVFCWLIFGISLTHNSRF